MSWEVSITATNQVVEAATVEYPVEVTPLGDNVFTVSNTVLDVAVNTDESVLKVYYNGVEIRLDNLNTFWRGQWVSGTGYVRGDIVEDEYSIYILKNFSPDITDIYTSTIQPKLDEAYWTRIYWKEAPFAHLTVTNYANVGTDLTVGDQLDVIGSALLRDSLDVLGAAQLNSTLAVVGKATLDDDLEVKKNALVQGELDVDSTATLNSLRVETTATIGLDLSVAGSLEIGGSSSFDSSSTFNSTVVVNSTMTLNSELIANSTATFNDLVEVKANLSVDSTATFSSDVVVANSLTVADLYADSVQVGGGVDGKALYIRGDTLLDGSLDVLGAATLHDTVEVTNSATINLNGTANFNGINRFNSSAQFYSSSTFYDTARFEGTDTFFKNAIVQNNLNVGGVNYPTNKGLNTQFLMTDGAGNASWQYLGEGTVWTLFTDLTTRGYNIKSGKTGGAMNDLVLWTGGDPANAVETPYGLSQISLGGTGNIKISAFNSATISAGKIALTASNYIHFYADDEIRFKSDVNFDKALEVADISANNLSVININAKSNTIRLNGLINVDDALILSPGGYIEFGDGTRQNTAAGTGGLGGSLIIYDESNILTSEASSINFRGPGVVASSIGSAVNVDIYATPLEVASGTMTYSTSTKKITFVGTGVNVSNVGDDITVQIIPVPGPPGPVGPTGDGEVNMTQDGYTNGYTIYADGPVDSTYLRLVGGANDQTATLNGFYNLNLENNANYIRLESRDLNPSLKVNSSGYISVNANTTATFTADEIEITASETITLDAPVINIGTGSRTVLNGDPVVIGSSAQTSNLWVERIENHNGDGPPYFPSGVRYPDGTVQYTAWVPNLGVLPPLVSYKGTVDTATVENFQQLVPVPEYFDAVVALDTQHVWIYTALGPLAGWFDASE